MKNWKRSKKEKLFPAIYATQKNLAESELYNYFTDEYENFTLSYLGEKVDDFSGKKKSFQLFKVRFPSDDNRSQSYLAVAGPYEPGSKVKHGYSDISGFYSHEEFEPGKLIKHLRAYLLQNKPARE